MNSLENVCVRVCRLSIKGKSLPNIKWVHRQHPTLNFSVGRTYKAQARKKLRAMTSAMLTSNRSLNWEGMRAGCGSKWYEKCFKYLFPVSGREFVRACKWGRVSLGQGLSEQLQAESCDNRKCRTAWSPQAVVGIGDGGRGETWLSGHVTSGLRRALHWSLVLCCHGNFSRFTFRFILSVGWDGTVDVCWGLGAWARLLASHCLP